jgi:hypothetical protein
LLIGCLCPYRYAILGAVLIDKDISESTNYVNLSAKLKGRTRDKKMIRVLFESRIKQRLLLSWSQETIEKIRESPNSTSALELLERVTKLGGTGDEDTTFHHDIMNELCNSTTKVEVILATYLLANYGNCASGTSIGKDGVLVQKGDKSQAEVTGINLAAPQAKL